MHHKRWEDIINNGTYSKSSSTKLISLKTPSFVCLSFNSLLSTTWPITSEKKKQARAKGSKTITRKKEKWGKGQTNNRIILRTGQDISKGSEDKMMQRDMAPLQPTTACNSHQSHLVLVVSCLKFWIIKTNVGLLNPVTVAFLQDSLESCNESIFFTEQWIISSWGKRGCKQRANTKGRPRIW